ncbi:MAG: Kef-type K+ transport system membrane subunit [Candidatus Gottesmanbacteria bacterium GW2011_GWC2_39_8]|uniref:Kef-type K+ transport system membrane subunit n=1 Tax=Candidatus Gottesmanbacteria bacterium GW2011_GWC2_39_8 TaxID=1618450 RepID=A0A0G0PVR8_9BACT|nr:MAG: Kef-type K+ transport system membrane subunit [Candidatus Gottesmanbacteria bacterium GW2011_GWC2_39_8]
MEQIPLLFDLIILLAISVPVSIFFHYLKLPPIIGFLITGVIIGPYGGKLIKEIQSVEMLAQIGIVLLMFAIGLEFSIAKMMKAKKFWLLGGGLQVLLTSGLVFIPLFLLDYPLPNALLIGFIVTLSSTAIILKLYTDYGMTDSPQGNLSIGILLFQDLAVIPMILSVHLLAGKSSTSPYIIFKTLFTALLSVSIIFLLSYFIVPHFLRQVVKLNNREVFTLTIFLLCLGTAWLTSSFGLSLALGAFVAGLVISESEYSHQIITEILPFKNVFNSIFFISIGMLFNLNFFLRNFLSIIGLSSIIIILKVSVLFFVTLLLGSQLRIALMVGFGLFQIGEFSFILLNEGKVLNLFSFETYQSLLSATFFTMLLTPFFVKKAPAISLFITSRLRISEKLTPEEEDMKVRTFKKHVIIVGYGLNGENLARVLKETGIPYLILDINANNIEAAKKEGHPALFGDANHYEVLKKANIFDAHTIVLAISDPIATRIAVKVAKEINPNIKVIVRTRYINQVEELYNLGADEVIPEEFETSIEIFSRVLREHYVPTNIILNQVSIIRSKGYEMLRKPAEASERLTDISKILAATITHSFLVTENSPANDKTLRKLDLRKISGASVIAIIQNGKAITNPSADFKIVSGDILVILGSHAQLDSALKILNPQN